MIVCRTVLRTQPWQLAKISNISTHPGSFQLRFKSCSSSMDWNKKGKSVNSVWRPLSTISNLNADLFEAACSSTVIPDNYESNAAEGGSNLFPAKHSISVEVGAALMCFIRGNGGGMQKSIEEEMGVKIIFPLHRNTDSLVIEGNSAQSIANASDKIQTVINEAVQSPNLDYSHFISLPLAIHPELVKKLFKFQNSVLKQSSLEEDTERNADLGIDKSIFINPNTFHLTVLMLKLWNRERVNAAKEVLQSISTKVMDVLDGRSLSVRLKGLKCMRGSVSKARVLYAPVEEVGNEDRLLQACKVIIDAYTQAGLVLEKDARHELKLHATLMNARHRKRKMGNKRMDTFDARYIFEEYGSEEWGEYDIREAHLSQRFAFDNRGYYHCCASLPFPTTRLQQ